MTGPRATTINIVLTVKDCYENVNIQVKQRMKYSVYTFKSMFAFQPIIWIGMIHIYYQLNEERYHINCCCCFLKEAIMCIMSVKFIKKIIMKQQT